MGFPRVRGKLAEGLKGAVSRTRQTATPNASSACRRAAQRFPSPRVRYRHFPASLTCVGRRRCSRWPGPGSPTASDSKFGRV